jgi:putative adhesin
MNKLLSRGVLIVIMIGVVSVPALCQREGQKEKSNDSFGCRDDWHSNKLVSHCEITEQTLAASDSTIAVDGRMNGGISIKGWERNEILMRARIQTAGPTEAEANELAKAIKVETAGSKIFASGPPNRTDHWWSVSYEIFVPLQSNLSLKTNNGGISIADVSGKLEFSALNGGVHLNRVGGNVRGGTTNGGLEVELSGDRWEGEALDVNTTNGGVSMSIPENYSAHLETGTVNGHLSIDFPVTVQGNITRELAVNLGSGGATVRAMTTNGGVKIRRSGGRSL